LNEIRVKRKALSETFGRNTHRRNSIYKMDWQQKPLNRCV